MADLNPEAVDTALRSVMEHIDYDLHKQIACDETTGENDYPRLVELFVDVFEDFTPAPAPSFAEWFLMNADFGPAHDDVMDGYLEQYAREMGVELEEDL